MKKVKVLKSVLVSNKERAAENRRFFDDMNALVVNIIASPGAGKTSFIRRIVGTLPDPINVLVIEGDIRGQIDSELLAQQSIDVIQINTETACHLDAFMIAQVLPQIKKQYDVVFVENVGNLVCPAEFEIGEDFKLAILSTAEGDDKPYKYPLLFHLAAVVVINKVDLMPHVDFDIQEATAGIMQENPHALLFPVSAKTGEGFKEITEFILGEVHAKKKKT